MRNAIHIALAIKLKKGRVVGGANEIDEVKILPESATPFKNLGPHVHVVGARCPVQHRAQGQAIGYISVPLSTVGGSYFNVNKLLANQTKDRIEARLGASSVWTLNPGAEGNLPHKKQPYSVNISGDRLADIGVDAVANVERCARGDVASQPAIRFQYHNPGRQRQASDAVPGRS
jgi:hypothetical protein